MASASPWSADLTYPLDPGRSQCQNCHVRAPAPGLSPVMLSESMLP